MIWTAWNNGSHHASGAGYGFKIASGDRDRYFRRDWDTVTVVLPERGSTLSAEVNVAKKSFWSEKCREVISRDIGRWLLDSGYTPWPHGSPPKFEVEPVGSRRFAVRRRIPPNKPLQRTGFTGR